MIHQYEVPLLCPNSVLPFCRTVQTHNCHSTAKPPCHCTTHAQWHCSTSNPKRHRYSYMKQQRSLSSKYNFPTSAVDHCSTIWVYAFPSSSATTSTPLCLHDYPTNIPLLYDTIKLILILAIQDFHNPSYLKFLMGIIQGNNTGNIPTTNHPWTELVFCLTRCTCW